MMSKLSRNALAGLVTTGLIATATLAASHAAGPSNKAVAARHAQMQVIGYSIGLLGGIAKGEMEFESSTVDSAAQNIALLAKLDTTTLWPEGTEQGATDGSRAKPEIWTNREGFNAAFADLEQAATAVVGAADAAAVGAAMKDLGGACKACHEKFRGPKN